jgi:hypothetical protein
VNTVTNQCLQEIEGSPMSEGITSRTVIGAPAVGSDPIKDHLAHLALAQGEKLRQRARETSLQSDVTRSPRERIETWERLHELRLPTTPTHPLVRIIARVTGLEVGDVHEEQRRRISCGARPTPSSESLSWNSNPIR